MKSFNLNRNSAQLALLQRIELADGNLKKIRKIFGRYLFSKMFSKYFINIEKISENYSRIMGEEFNTIKKFILDKKIFKYRGWHWRARAYNPKDRFQFTCIFYRKKLCIR